MGLSEHCTPVPTTIVWDASMASCYFGEHHPMDPARLVATANLTGALGLFDLPQVSREESRIADDHELQLVHSQKFITAVKEVGANPENPQPDYGLGTEDTPAYSGMHEASARLAGSSLIAAQKVLEGSAVHAVNFAGGMHHASESKASGFCVYNDCAVAIQYLLDQGVRRIAYIDVDAHHGDGTQNIFWDNPNVLTISMHESGATLFPWTGFCDEIGPDGVASGTSVNIALPKDVSNAGWVRAFDAVVPQVLREFQPEIIVSQHGCDAHQSDHLTHLKISIDAQREVAAYISLLASELCEGRWIATGGGGYSLFNAAPRAWAHLVGIASGSPVSRALETPQRWRHLIQEKYGVHAPERMGDGWNLEWLGWSDGYNPEEEIDRAIIATRKRVFPQWGLDPYYD